MDFGLCPIRYLMPSLSATTCRICSKPMVRTEMETSLCSEIASVRS